MIWPNDISFEGFQKKNRFFRETKDNEEFDWVEISKEEYMQRKNES